MKFRFLFLVYSLVFATKLLAATDIVWKDCGVECVRNPNLNYGSLNAKSSQIFVSEKFKTPECAKYHNCWIFFGEIAHSLQFEINGKKVIFTDENANPKYLHARSIAFPIMSSVFEIENQIKIQIVNLNKSFIGFKNNTTIIDSYENIKRETDRDYFSRTGISLLSAYSLLVLLISFVFLWLITKDKKIITLISYNTIAILYLLSFSELPREYLNPVLFSGVVHFSLRLLQDFLLIVVFANVFDYQKKWLNFVKATYLICILSMIFTSIFISIDYKYFLVLMKIFAPLVALPMIFGFYLARKINEINERKVLTPLFFILMLMQINDLLVFWQFYKGIFFVKWYPPLILISMILVFIRREAAVLSQLKLNAHLTELSKKLAHDIRSPLSTLNMIAFQMQNEDLKSMQIQVMNQINQIADDVLKEGRSINSQIRMNTHKIEHSESIAISNKQKHQDQDTLIAINPFFDSLNKEYEFKSIALKQKIIFVNNVKDKNYSISKSLSSVLYRTINNCIQNSVEATANTSQALISIEFNNSDNSQKELKITIKDNGKGIPASVLTSLGHKPLSYGKDGSDESGNGIAVYNAKKDLEHHKSTLYIDSVEGVGTTVILLCPVYS